MDTCVIRLTDTQRPATVNADAWLEFIGGRLPLPPTECRADGTWRLRIVTAQTLRHGRPGQYCVHLEGSVFDLDASGYLLPPERPPSQLAAARNVVDAQYRFYLRRARHRHGWQPSATLCRTILELLSEPPTGPAGGFPYD